MNSFALIIAIVAFSLFLDILFVRKKHATVGYLLGLLPILVYWGNFMRQLPSAEYCRTHGVACEWTGIGVYMFSGLSLVMAIVYSFLALTVSILYRRRFSTGDFPSRFPFTEWQLALAAVLVVVASMIGGGVVGRGAYNLVQTGLLNRWQYLGNPPENSLTARLPGEKAAKIQSFNTGMIQVETNQGRAFRTEIEGCLSRLRLGQNCWYYGSGDPILHGTNLVNCRQQFWVSRPPGKVIDTVRTTYCDALNSIHTEYALAEDGSIWAWRYQARYDPFTPLLGTFPGAFLGLVAGAFTVRRLSTRTMSVHLASPQ